MAPFEELNGVLGVSAGYTGGHTANPTYPEVCSQTTGHYEAVQVTFDPSLISYTRLLDTFWHQIDPTDPGGQFQDRGASYKTAIFYHNEEQKQTALASRNKLAESGCFQKPIVTAILPASPFYPAENYHQAYHKTNACSYQLYRQGSGREEFIKKHWPRNNTRFKEKLSKLQYHVTQEEGTEPPFANEY